MKIKMKRDTPEVFSPSTELVRGVGVRAGNSFFSFVTYTPLYKLHLTYFLLYAYTINVYNDFTVMVKGDGR